MYGRVCISSVEKGSYDAVNSVYKECEASCYTATIKGSLSLSLLPRRIDIMHTRHDDKPGIRLLVANCRQNEKNIARRRGSGTIFR